MALDGCINLHIRDEAAPTSSFWSRDDAKFTIVAPLLVGAAILCPKARWHQSARLIESISNRSYGNSSPSTTIVCERLGIAQDRLRQIIEVSRVNRTEHLIHVIHSLLRKNWRPRFEITGRQYLDEALADGKGAVLWVAHFSFASLFTKMALSQAGYRISHISRPEHGVSKSRFGVRYLNWFRSAAKSVPGPPYCSSAPQARSHEGSRPGGVAPERTSEHYRWCMGRTPSRNGRIVGLKLYGFDWRSRLCIRDRCQAPAGLHHTR